LKGKDINENERVFAKQKGVGGCILCVEERGGSVEYLIARRNRNNEREKE